MLPFPLFLCFLPHFSMPHFFVFFLLYCVLSPPFLILKHHSRISSLCSFPPFSSPPVSLSSHMPSILFSSLFHCLYSLRGLTNFIFTISSNTNPSISTSTSHNLPVFYPVNKSASSLHYTHVSSFLASPFSHPSLILFHHLSFSLSILSPNLSAFPSFPSASSALPPPTYLPCPLPTLPLLTLLLLLSPHPLFSISCSSFSLSLFLFVLLFPPRVD